MQGGRRVYSSCDVVIAGGGPAGSAAAIWCASLGLEVRLLEARLFPRDRPGESLHPGIEPLFDQLGLRQAIDAAGFPRYRGHWVGWGGPVRFQAFGEDSRGRWLGFHAWRAHLDGILMGRAETAGARILQPCRALAPIFLDGRIAGLRTEAGEIRARFVLDATGSRHWLHRHAGLGLRRTSRRLIATYGYSTDAGQNFPADPILMGDPAGWTWIARVRPELIAWTKLDFNGPRRQPPAAIQTLARAGPIRGADVTWRIVDACAGSGYFAIGDAASVLDPAASHGVLKALMSGILAASLIGQVCRGALAEPAAAAHYRAWTGQWFERDSRRLLELYAALQAPSDTGAVYSAPLSAAKARISLR
jgi:flavin-dependent dehydrogenase